MNKLKTCFSRYSTYLIFTVFLFYHSAAKTQITCKAKFCYEAVLDTNGNICITYHNFSTSNDSIIEYFWNFNCAGVFSSLFEPVICFPITWCPPGTTVTQLSITTINNCVSTFIDTVFLGTNCFTSVSEKSTEKKEFLDLYPNPAGDFIMYRTDISDTENAMLVIYNMLGEALHTEKISIHQQEGRVDLSEFVSGMYLYKVYINNAPVRAGPFVISK